MLQATVGREREISRGCYRIRQRGDRADISHVCNVSHRDTVSTFNVQHSTPDYAIGPCLETAFATIGPMFKRDE